MAAEDKKATGPTMEMLEALVKSREETWAKMMESLPGSGYEIVGLREEAGFTARLAIKKPAGAPRGILIVCAGGGFRFKSYNEALPVAEYFFEKGIGAAILDYHVKSDGPMKIDPETNRMAGEDGLEAVRYLREHAARYNILPDRIAIGGFSAGGMLSGYAATQFARTGAGVSSRPDAALILYGAFSATSSVPAGPGGMTRLEIAEANRIDNARNIRTDCPPMFVFQTHGDDPRIALGFCMELAVHGVPYEIHTFEDGPHGGGLYNGKDETPDEPHTALWAPIAADWLLRKGY